jgi:hypothetical protein
MSLLCSCQPSDRRGDWPRGTSDGSAAAKDGAVKPREGG